MKRFITLFAAVLFTSPILADYHPAIEYGVSETVVFNLYNTDGTLDVDEADGGAEVTLVCDGAAGVTATNDFVDEGSSYSLVVTAAEAQCEILTVEVAATDLNVIHVPTYGNASALQGLQAWVPAWDAEVQSEVADALVAYDPPTNTEMIARTQPTADYFDAAADAVANVTLVATTTTNTDMRGTDGGATAASVADVPTVAEFNARTLVAANYFDPAVDGVIVTTNNDKTGYSLTQTFPTNFADLSITATTGRVDVGEWLGVAVNALETAVDFSADLLGTSCAAPGAGTIEEQLCTDIDGIYLDTIAGGAGPWTTGGGAAAPTEAEMYTYFTSIGREDLFKAAVTSLATSAEISALNDPTAAAIAAAVMASTCEDQGAGYTVQECLSIILAEAAGTGTYTSGTRTWALSDPSGTETRLTIVYGAELDGDRTTSTPAPMTP